MKLYFAGAESNDSFELLEECGVKNLLFSFFYLKKNHDLKELKKQGYNIFMDSGGFTSFKKKIDINPHDYGTFLKDNEKNIELAANLDIGPFKEQWKHQIVLEKYYSVMPVYHTFDYFSKDREVLSDLLKNYDYIALGGMVGFRPMKRLNEFLNYCFKHSVRGKTKYHGFGVSSFDRMEQYPFYSTDASSWLTLTRYGTASMYKGLTKGNKSLSYKNKEHALEFNLDPNALKDSKALRNQLTKVILNTLKMEEEITNLWTARGVTWE